MVAALALTAIWTSTVDVAQAGGGIKGDEATYVGLAASAGYDGDLVYSASDYQRFKAWYGSGPEGIFLKRGVGGRLYFGKAYLYGLVAAPWVRLGGLQGLLFFNLACVAAVVAAGAWWLGADARPGMAWAFASVFVLASVAPLYAFWLTADILNFTLVFLAFAFAVPRPGGRPRGAGWQVAGVVCLAGAIFSKPLNLPLALPLALACGGGVTRRALTSLIVIGACVAAFFAVNALVTGELNYQGGERKTFYGEFPFDEAGRSFDASGLDMTTNTVATPVGEGGRLVPLAQNAWYFIVGRHFGLVPFGWPWLMAVILWVARERTKTRWQFALVAAMAVAAIGTIVWMPYTWSGGGGPIGNRYFLSLGAASFFLVPPLRSLAPITLAAIGLVFVAPALASPFAATRGPWMATRAIPFSVLPLELTGASDFPVILDPRRGRIPQGRRPTVFVALLDDASGAGRGGWLSIASGASADLLVRSPERLEQVTVGVRSIEACRVTVWSGEEAGVVVLGAGDRKDTLLSPVQTFSRDSFVFVLSIDATGCAAPIEVALQGHSTRRAER